MSLLTDEDVELPELMLSITRPKMPPPAWFVFCSLINLALARIWPLQSLHHLDWSTGVACIFVVLAAVIALLALWAFIRAKTTIHPHHPEHTRVLICQGIYQKSRNPMYLALLLLLLAQAIAWGSWYGAIVSLTLLGWALQQQIVFEESILQGNFAGYADYCLRTRRWF